MGLLLNLLTFLLFVNLAYTATIPPPYAVRHHTRLDDHDRNSWRVESEGLDHITYVRKRPLSNQLILTEQSTNKPDCNETTTTTAPTASEINAGDLRSRSSGISERRRNRLEVRSRNIKSDSSTNKHSSAGEGYSGGDYWWMVSHKTDDHITYTKRKAGQQGQGVEGHDERPASGELRQLGSGRDTVLARVVDQKDVSTEEGLLSNQNSGSGRSSHKRGGYPTHELVHPYASSINRTWSDSSLKTKSHKYNRSNSTRQQSRHRSGKSRRPTTESPSSLTSSETEVDQSGSIYPRIGDVVDGWRVVSKSKEHISWERLVPTVTTPSPLSPVAALPPPSSQSASGLVRSLDRTNSARGISRSRNQQASSSSNIGGHSWRRGGKIPSAEGVLVEGFPRVFDTYSRATWRKNVESTSGTIRTSLSNTTNWSIGDELAGWKVIGKDHRGIIWEKIKVDGDSNLNKKSGGVGGVEDLNEEDLLIDTTSSSESDEDGNSGKRVYRGPPGSWYLDKETRNSITWRRDNLPADIIFEMDAYPRVGDIQSGWRVSNKDRNSISWERVDKEISSEEVTQ